MENTVGWSYFLHGFLLALHGQPWPERTIEALQSKDVDDLMRSLAALRVELDGRHGSGWTNNLLSKEFPDALDFMQQL